MQKPAVLLLAHGTPETISEIPAYLANVTSGRPLPPAVVDEIKHRYSLIGRSPLTEITMQQAARISAELGLPTYVGMRNWKPYIRDTVLQMAADGVTHALTICLAPHNSRTSVGLYRRAVIGETGKAPFTVDFVPEWHSEPLLIRAFSEKLRDGWSRACLDANAPVPVLFTAHSVPVRTIEAGDDYERQTRETAELVAATIPEINGHWRFAFQSQGMSGGEWLGPTVESVIEELAVAGHKYLFVQPIGFVCDHVEVLYDVDIAFKNFADAKGIALTRAESLNDSVLFARAVAQLARTRFASMAQSG
ncbi:MAG TPA: ferrochelatase [Candidatus Saccharimonadales bacterium]|nr:ferrochelatase [Candidatus Saccharimonadales bacterium]